MRLIQLLVFILSTPSLFAQVKINDIFTGQTEHQELLIEGITIEHETGKYLDPSLGEFNHIPVHKLLDFSKDDSGRYNIPYSVKFLNCVFPETFIVHLGISKMEVHYVVHHVVPRSRLDRVHEDRECDREKNRSGRNEGTALIAPNVALGEFE